MSVRLNIHGGTPKSGPTLCHSCKNANIVKGQNCEERVTCTAYGLWQSTNNLVIFRVSECRKYHPSNMPWLAEMEEMAWKVEAHKRGPAGFADGTANEMEITIKPPEKKYEPELGE